MSTVDLPLFDFRIVVAFDSQYGTWIARCLETGSVATAESAETCRTMIRELLQDELQYALDHNNLANLFNAPASPAIWGQYYYLDGERVELKWDAKWKLPQSMGAAKDYGAIALMVTEVTADGK